jgi:hypothetical protein
MGAENQEEPERVRNTKKEQRIRGTFAPNSVLPIMFIPMRTERVVVEE